MRNKILQVRYLALDGFCPGLSGQVLPHCKTAGGGQLWTEPAQRTEEPELAIVSRVHSFWKARTVQMTLLVF
jgi:hypothetical protein